MLVGILAISGGKIKSRSSHPHGTRSSAVGTPTVIHSPKVSCMPANSLRKPRVTGFAAVPAGEPIPPNNGPQATAIISPRPKLLCNGLHPATRRMPNPAGSNMAATAMSVSHIESKQPVVRNPRRRYLGRFPNNRMMDRAIRLSSPLLTTPAAIIMRPKRKSITLFPNPSLTIWAN
ncbi:hypothetical protein ES703_66516 [subsurface metagenome]